jgi:ATP-dependent DNA helicase RecQ
MEAVFEKVCKVFGFQGLNKFQIKAIAHILEKKSDIFVNLPTGYGKSVIYQAIPVVFENENPIVLVVSPLISLMKDQVARLNSCSIPSILLNETAPEQEERVLNGEFNVVFGSPESWLNNNKWRTMAGSSVYKNRVKAVAVDEAHVINHWYATMHISHTHIF